MSGSLTVRAIAPCTSSWDSFIASFHHFFDVCGEGRFTIFFLKFGAVAFWWEGPKIETGLDCLEREVVITLCTISNTFFVVFVLILVVVDVVHTVSKEINFKLDFVVYLIEDGARGGVTFRIKDGVVSLNEVEGFSLSDGMVRRFFFGVDLLDNVEAGLRVGEGISI